MELMTREIKRAVSKGQTFQSVEKSLAEWSDASRECVATSGEVRGAIVAELPVVERRDMIATLAELEPLPEGTVETDPRKILASTLTDLTNQQSRMN